MIDLLDFDGWIEKDRLLFENGRRPMYGILFQTCGQCVVFSKPCADASAQAIAAKRRKRGAGLQWRPQNALHFEALTEPAGETSPLDRNAVTENSPDIRVSGLLMFHRIRSILGAPIRGLSPYRSAPL